MEAYKVERDTMAFLLTPVKDEKGEWNGMVNSALALHPDTELKGEVLATLFNLATLISAFIDVVQDDEYVYDTVTARRDEILEENYSDEEDEEEEYEVMEGTENKVIKITKFTKTQGSA